MPFRVSDLATLLLIAVFAGLGLTVHDTVAQLASLGRGVEEAGAAVDGSARAAAGALRDGFGDAAAASESAPVVGGQVAEALRSAGEAAAGPVEREGTARARELTEAGRAGERQALETARLLGWLTFLVPTLLLLARVLPGRLREVRRRRTARRLLTAAPIDPRRAAALASRAAYGLPWEALARHTDDPIGDLVAGEHVRLVEALGAEDAGLRVRARGGRA
jgi:hypothetical protein